MPSALLRSLNDQIDRGRQPAPVRRLFLQLRAPGRGQRIKLRLSPRFRFRPFRFDPGFLFQPVQSGIERALLNLKNFLGDLLNALGNRPTVFRFERDGFEDEEIESALNEIAWLTHTMTIYTSDCR